MTTARFDPSSSQRSVLITGGGTGIGLALVRGLVALHGGTVSAQSEGAGKGSTFTIHLPESTLVVPRDIQNLT